MKKMFVVSLLAAAFAIGCSKKNPQTTPPTGSQTEMKKEGTDKGMGGDTYGGDKAGGGADPCAAPK